MKPRKTYSEKFKTDTLAAWEKLQASGKNGKEAATSLKIPVNMLYKWQIAMRGKGGSMKLSRQVSTKKAAKLSSSDPLTITVKRGEKALQAQVRELKELALMKLVARTAIAGRLS